MFEVRNDDDESVVFVSGKALEILDAGDDYVLAECSLDDLINEVASPFPDGLQVEIHSEDGFGTYFFHELTLGADKEGVLVAFRCHTPKVLGGTIRLSYISRSTER